MITLQQKMTDQGRELHRELTEEQEAFVRLLALQQTIELRRKGED